MDRAWRYRRPHSASAWSWPAGRAVVADVVRRHGPAGPQVRTGRDHPGPERCRRGPERSVSCRRHRLHPMPAVAATELPVTTDGSGHRRGRHRPLLGLAAPFARARPRWFVTLWPSWWSEVSPRRSSRPGGPPGGRSPPSWPWWSHTDGSCWRWARWACSSPWTGWSPRAGPSSDFLAEFGWPTHFETAEHPWPGSRVAALGADALVQELRDRRARRHARCGRRRARRDESSTTEQPAASSARRGKHVRSV